MGQLISLTSQDGATCSAYRASPKTAPRGGLVVCQEVFGVNKHIQGVCDRFAEAGYLTIAPALFDRIERDIDFGYSSDELQAGLAIMRKLDLRDALKDVEAAAAVAGEGGKVGVVGYCWGGTVAWAAATRLKSLSAAVGYYGGGIGGLVDEMPSCPVLLHFGSKDQSIPLSVADQVKERHPGVRTYIYDAGHGFNCDQRASYDAASAALAMERTLAFLDETLV